MEKPFKINNLRWIVSGLIACAAIVNYVDRTALAVMWPVIAKEIGASKEGYALLVTVFMVSYGIGQSAFGKIFDAFGTRLGFLLSVFFWSLSIGAHALAGSVVSFCVLRTGLGFSEAGNWPGATKANGEWFPLRERALAQGLFNAGASIGAIVSAPLIAFLFTVLGWKATFATVGALGLLWILPWLAVYRGGPETHGWLTGAERDMILSDRSGNAADRPEEPAPRWQELLRFRQTWAIILTRFFLDPVWWLFVSWLPLYLADRFGFDVKQIGLFAWVPYVGAMLGSLSGGWLSGRLIRAGWPVDLARKGVVTAGGAVMLPALLLTMYAADPVQAVLLIAMILFGFQVAINNIQTLPSDYFGTKSVGTLAGMGGTAATCGTLATTWLVPAMTKLSYAPIFALGAALVPLSVLSLWLLGGPRKPSR